MRAELLQLPKNQMIGVWLSFINRKGTLQSRILYKSFKMIIVQKCMGIYG